MAKQEKCPFCGGAGDHRECAEAFGLDYDPKSQEDARQWLARRRAFIERELLPTTKAEG